MNAQEAKDKLGITDRELAEFDVIDPAQLVVMDEFLSRKPGEYRERAVKRLLKARVSFSAVCSITLELLHKTVKPVCPCCQKTLQLDEVASGDMHRWTVHATCKACRLKINLSVPVDGIDITFEE